MKEDRLRQLAEEDYDNKRAKMKEKGEPKAPLFKYED